MKEIIMMIKSKVEEFSSGQMEESTMENGTMANNTVRESITHLNRKSKRESGKKERELDGSQMNEDLL